jgi:hypothetical protein
MELEPFLYKFLYIPSLKKFYGIRTEGLDEDKRILWVPLMEANLM